MAIDLNKITLEKQGDSHKIDLTKGGSNLTKEIIINLNWSQPEKKKGFWGAISNALGGSGEIDLDLGCFYELSDGRKSVIDGLQFSHGQGGPRNKFTRQGCYTEAPWVWHSGDDRSGGAGENILVNPAGLGELKRLVIYCFIYEGVARWALSNAIATVKVAGNPDIVVEMGQQTDSRMFCAVAEILFDKESITVKKLISFHNGHEECDKAYNWGMRWQAGSK